MYASLIREETKDYFTGGQEEEEYTDEWTGGDEEEMYGDEDIFGGMEEPEVKLRYTPILRARGVDFPMLLHESVKGLFELLSLSQTYLQSFIYLAIFNYVFLS